MASEHSASTATTAIELVAAVKRHALDHYEEDGWDIVIECWSDNEIAEAIGTARTEAGAVRAVRRAVKPVAEHRDEIQRTAF